MFQTTQSRCLTLLLQRCCLVVMVGFFISSCAKSPGEEQEGELTKGIIFNTNLVTKVEWVAASKELRLNGVASRTDTEVLIYDDKYRRNMLGSINVKTNLSWAYRTTQLNASKAPCKVLVMTNSMFTRTKVTNAPANCSTGNNPSASVSNSAPNSIIQKPVSNITILAGESVNFNGRGTDADGTTQFSYFWTFSGVAPNSDLKSPGAIKFSKVGTYPITFAVTDSSGLTDSTPAKVNVIVTSAVPPPPDISNSPPNGIIIMPTSNVVINAGETVGFKSIGTDPEGDKLKYNWNFGDSSIAPSLKQNPGTIIFKNPGVFKVSLLVSDSKKSDPTPATLTVTVKSTVATNLPPNSKITVPKTNLTLTVGSSYTFKGSAVDPDGDTALSFNWDFSGYAPNKVGKIATVKFDKPGKVVVKLKVKDSKNLWDPTPAQVIVNVNAGSAPVATIVSPIANLTIYEGNSVNFKGNGTDIDGDFPLKFLWKFSGAVANKSVKNAGNIKFDTAGKYAVTLTVTDSSGAVDVSSAITVTVKAKTINAAPVGKINKPFTLSTITVGDSLTFTGSATDADGDVISYKWNFGLSGLPLSTKKSPGLLKFTKSGKFTITLTVTDAKGLSDLTPEVVTVNVKSTVSTGSAPNGKIEAPITNIVIPIGNSYTFKASATDADGDTNISYFWDFGGYTLNAAGKSVTVKFDTADTVLVKLKVKDSSGKWDPTPAMVEVVVQSILAVNEPPETIITAPASNSTIQRGESIFFSGNATDPDGDFALTYLWDFDGMRLESTKQIPGRVIFNTVGFYTVQLTATDSKGLADPTPAFRYVFVTENNNGNSAPESVIESPVSDVTINVGESLRFAATGSDVENNTPLKYFWNYDGAYSNSTVQNPGDIMFGKAGVYRIELTVTDSLGASDATPDVRVVTVIGAVSQSAPNSLITSPGSNLTIEVGSSINFTGEGTDDDGDTPFSYLWNFDGAVPNTGDKNPGETVFNNGGVYNISFRVTDSTSISDPTPAFVQVIVQNTLSVNEPPTGLITSPSSDLIINAGDSVDFRGTGYDPDGDLLSYVWTFGGIMPNETGRAPGMVLFAEAGRYAVTMTVSDPSGLSDPTPSVRTITVKPNVVDPIAPNASILTPVTGLFVSEGDVVNFSGIATDPDSGTPFKYFWNFDGAAPNSIEQNPGDVTFYSAGSYRVQFNVTDTDGLSDPTPAERWVIVEKANTPTSNASPVGVIMSPVMDVSIIVGESVEFTALASDPDRNFPISFRWNMDGVIPNSTAQNPGSVTFNQVGTYRIVLTVTDSLGTSDITPVERVITVKSAASSNKAPSGTIISPAATSSIKVGESLYFTASGADPDNNLPLKFIWDFGGVQLNKVGATVGDVVFESEGDFDIYLKVVDSMGLIDPTPQKVTVTVSANVINANLPPSGNIDAPIGNRVIEVGQSLVFSGNGSDPESGVVSYAWDFGASGIPASTVKQPGVKTFNREGVFTISLTVTDNKGLADPTPQVLTITVNAVPVVSDGRPNSVITNPGTAALVLNVGDSYTFKGTVSDPDGDTNLYSYWNFDGYTLNQSGTSATVKFSQKGTLTIKFHVKDSNNLWDKTPAEVNVTVK